MAPTLLVGSCEPFSGKSAVVLGLARQLLRQGVEIRFGKPLATSLDSPAEMTVGTPLLDADVRFVGATLGLPDSQLIPSLQVADPQQAQQRLLQGNLDPGAGFSEQSLQLAAFSEGLTLLEAGGSMDEGLLKCVYDDGLVDIFFATDGVDYSPQRAFWFILILVTHL